MAKTINPFDIINHLDREFDGLFGKLVDTARTAREHTTSWTPAMSVTESSDAFEVTLDAPGMQSDAFDITLKEGVLAVTGERVVAESDDIKWHRSERRFGSFNRTVQVGEDVDVNRLDAEYKDGVLRIVLPRKDAVKPTRINVR